VDALPEWAQKLLAKTRGEAANNRTKATEQAQALEATREAIAKALGLKGDDDPVAAARTAAEQREAAQSVARNLRIENAVLRAAGKAGADPLSLTDSRSFMAALEALDPEADDFAGQVDKAIVAALIANPNLRLVPAAPPPRSGGPVGGGAAVPGQLTREDLKGMSPEAVEKARQDGQLDTLLGITH
jgi:phosphopantetheinyl transferase (holo-ACP synthase)